MQQLETALMTVIWHTVLERFSATSLSLQKVEIDLLNAVKLYDDSFCFKFGTYYETGEKAKSYVESTNTKKQLLSY